MQLGEPTRRVPVTAQTNDATDDETQSLLPADSTRARTFGVCIRKNRVTLATIVCFAILIYLVIHLSLLAVSVRKTIVDFQENVDMRSVVDETKELVRSTSTTLHNAEQLTTDTLADATDAVNKTADVVNLVAKLLKHPTITLSLGS